MSRSNRKTAEQRAMEASQDYGEFAGVGSSHFVGGKLLVEGVKPGREAEFMAALATLNDAASRRLRAKVQEPPAVWDRELRTWVRKRVMRGITVPDSIGWRWRAA
ncbi:MAG: hypothetical protein IT436_09800 [Phycisphaerales bacterium]|nr:hypothetical protein [Phycisphaerales bacterium]